MVNLLELAGLKKEEIEALSEGRILFIINGGLGDAAMMTPAITACAISNVSEPGYHVDVFAMRGNARLMRPLWRLLAEREPYYDICVLDKPDTEIEYEAALCPCAKSVLEERIERYRIKTKQLITPRTFRGHGQYLDLAEQMNAYLHPHPLKNLLKPAKRDAIILGPGTGPGGKNQKKRWGGWDKLIKKLPRPFFIIGAADAGDYEIPTDPSDDVSCSLVGKTKSIEELIPYLERCRLYIGVDNGLGHLAAAFGIPTVTIFRPELREYYKTNPLDYLPFGELASAVMPRGKEVWHGDVLNQIYLKLQKPIYG